VLIARGDADDLPEVRSLLATRGWDEDFDLGRGPVYIARDQKVIGCLQIIIVSRGLAVVDLMLVDESTRRKGVGTALISVASANHPGKLYLSCREDAVAFYERLGFALVPGGIDQAPEPVKAYWRRVRNRASLAMVNERT
jgi:N-acetylglutamate synthase-like GNAT family acetyltransferase